VRGSFRVEFEHWRRNLRNAAEAYDDAADIDRLWKRKEERADFREYRREDGIDRALPDGSDNGKPCVCTHRASRVNAKKCMGMKGSLSEVLTSANFLKGSLRGQQENTGNIRSSDHQAVISIPTFFRDVYQPMHR
jgi:hypothetical protein